MALSNIVKHSHDAGVIQLSDGTGTPITLNMRYDNADFTFSGLNRELREVVTYAGRGKTRSVRLAAPTYPTGSFSLMVTDLSETGTGTLIDWIAKTPGSPFASRVTTLTIGDVDCCDVRFLMEGTTYGDSADHTVELLQAALSFDFSEGEPNTITCNFTCYGNIEINGAALFTAPR